MKAGSPDGIPAEAVKYGCNFSDVNNYRAITLDLYITVRISCCMATVILDSFQSCDSHEDDLQFGFKHGHSTSIGCSVLKHVVDNYIRSRGIMSLLAFLIYRKPLTESESVL